jgi:adenylate cyclase
LRKLLAGFLLGAGAAAIVMAIAAGGLFETAELKLYDWRMRLAASPDSVNNDIVLVGINDTTIRDVEPLFGHWPWPRVALSFVVEYLSRAPAKVVAIDITLSERDRVDQYDLNGTKVKGQASDQMLADAVKASGNVIMLADAVNEGLVSGETDRTAAVWRDAGYRGLASAEPRPIVAVPYQSLTDASTALGHNYLVLDQDGPARRMTPFIENNGRFMPSLGVAAALEAGGFTPEQVSSEGPVLRIGDRRIPLVPNNVPDLYTPGQSHDQWTMLINFRAPSRLAGGKPPYSYYEFRHLLLSEQQLQSGEKPLVDPAVFKDKIVFLGFTAAGLMDVFTTPVSDDRAGTMPGIQLHASIADSILASRFITPASPRARIASVLLVAITVGLLSAFLPFAIAAATAAAVLGGWTWLTVSAFKDGTWLNLVQPVAAGGIALFAGTAYRYFVEDREKRKMKRLFGRYVSRDVYEQLTAHPELAELGGKRRDMSVLFSDIRGFTTVTEKGNPEELVAQLNEYFSRMVDVVFRHKGTVDKFVGDMVMALYGAPLDDVDHAEHAVEAAIDMVRELGILNKGWAERGMAQLDIGVGINSGDMIAGNIGSSSIMSYTVIGDNVNLGSRLESLNKDYKTRIIISDATRTRLKGQYDIRPLGDVVVKGKTKPVAIFQVCVPAPIQELGQPI